MEQWQPLTKQIHIRRTLAHYTCANCVTWWEVYCTVRICRYARESFERIPKIVILLFNFYHRKQNMFCAMLVTYLTSSVNIWAEPELRCVSHIFSFTVSSHAHCIHKIFVHLNEWALIRAHHSSWKIKKIIIINRSRQSHMNMIHVNNNFISACNCILFALDLHIHHTFGHVV